MTGFDKERAEFESTFIKSLPEGTTVSLKKDKHGEYMAEYVRTCLKLWNIARAEPKFQTAIDGAADPRTPSKPRG